MNKQILTLFDLENTPVQPEAKKPGTRKGMSSHQSAAMETDEWLTPPEIIRSLGDFDLDPCAPAKRPWEMAKKHYALPQNGLALPWEGRVWLNPPYGRRIGRWMKKMARYANGISLIFARTEVVFWHKWVWPYASSMLFIEGRLHFYTVEGVKAPNNAGAPSVLIAYGRDNVEALGDCGIKGKFVPLNVVPLMIVGISPSWKDVVCIALDRANGEAAIQEIYDQVEIFAPDKCIKNQHWKSKVRQQVQECFDRISRGYYRKRDSITIPDTGAPC